MSDDYSVSLYVGSRYGEVKMATSVSCAHDGFQATECALRLELYPNVTSDSVLTHLQFHNICEEFHNNFKEPKSLCERFVKLN